MTSRWNVRTLVAPATEPVTVAEAKAWLRIDGSDDDASIAGLIAAARARIERATGRLMVEQTVELRLPAFSAALVLPRSPVSEIMSVKYVDEAGELQTLDADTYIADLADEAPSITPAYGLTWPSTRVQAGAVIITAVCGYGDATEVPADLKHAVSLLVADAYANREGQSVASAAVETLIGPYRLSWCA